MKRSYSFIILAFFLLTALIGCSLATEDKLSGESGWTPVLTCTADPPTYLVGFLNEQFGISLGIKGEIHYTDDGGKTWTEGANGLKWRLCLDIADADTAWCGGNGGSVYTSGDGAKTWSRVKDINLMLDHHNIDFIDSMSGWVSTRSRLAGTNDGGQTWTEISLPEGADGVAAICLRTPQNGYFLSHDGMLYLTGDGGATWTGKDLGFKDYDIIDLQKQPRLNKMSLATADISFADENNGTIVFIGKSASGGGHHIWCLTTGDGGTTWRSESISVTEISPTKVFITGDGQYLTLSDGSNNAVVLKRKT